MVGEYTFTAEVLKNDYRASESVEQRSDSISCPAISISLRSVSDNGME